MYIFILHAYLTCMFSCMGIKYPASANLIGAQVSELHVCHVQSYLDLELRFELLKDWLLADEMTLYLQICLPTLTLHVSMPNCAWQASGALQ